MELGRPDMNNQHNGIEHVQQEHGPKRKGVIQYCDRLLSCPGKALVSVHNKKGKEARAKCSLKGSSILNDKNIDNM